MKNTKSLLFKILVILLTQYFVLVISAASIFAAADVYPSKPVRFILPTAQGGSQDILARLIAVKLYERLGKQVIVENRGGSMVIGTEIVAKADPDGYTLLSISGGHTIQPALQKLPYDPIKSFTPIALVASLSQAFVVHPSVPANSVKEFIAIAKQKQGQLIFAIGGIGGTPHMAVELFRIMAGIDFKIVHFKGSGPVTVDLLGGHSAATIGTLPALLPHIKSGKLRVLGTTGVKRSVFLQDVPTIAEAGVPGYEATTWYGFLAPAGTPGPIVDRLNKEMKEILTLDEVKNLYLNEGMELNYLGPTEFGKFFKKEMTHWASVVKKANIKLE